MTETVPRNQSMSVAERCHFDWSEEQTFSKSERRGFHSLQERTTTAPSRVQFMPTTRNIKVQGFFICHMINYTGYNQK